MQSRCSATVPLSFNWTLWYKDFSAKNTDWRLNVQKLYDVSTAENFLRVYRDVKLPSAMPLGTSYYFFKKGIRPVWEEEPNKGAGAWKMFIDSQSNNDLNLVWSDLLFMLISDGFNELSSYLCGITCNTRRGTHTVTVWTVKTTASNYQCIMKIGKILKIVVQNIYGLKCLKYKLHANSSNGFDYVL